MSDAFPNGEESIDSIKNVAGLILGVSENRSWIELFFDKRENILNPAEIVTEISVPYPKAGSKGFYHKVRARLAWDHAIVAVAAVVQSSGGAASDARVGLGGVAPIPWRAPKAEDFVRGKKIDEETAQKAADIALEGARALKDNVYKVGMAKSLVQRALLASV